MRVFGPPVAATRPYRSEDSENGSCRPGSFATSPSPNPVSAHHGQHIPHGGRELPGGRPFQFHAAPAEPTQDQAPNGDQAVNAGPSPGVERRPAGPRPGGHVTGEDQPAQGQQPQGAQAAGPLQDRSADPRGWPRVAAQGIYLTEPAFEPLDPLAGQVRDREAR